MVIPKWSGRPLAFNYGCLLATTKVLLSKQ
jgi:hypothetical protein